jgi:hypothetical protein
MHSSVGSEVVYDRFRILRIVLTKAIQLCLVMGLGNRGRFTVDHFRLALENTAKEDFANEDPTEGRNE